MSAGDSSVGSIDPGTMMRGALAEGSRASDNPLENITIEDLQAALEAVDWMVEVRRQIPGLGTTGI